MAMSVWVLKYISGSGVLHVLHTVTLPGPGAVWKHVVQIRLWQQVVIKSWRLSGTPSRQTGHSTDETIAQRAFAMHLQYALDAFFVWINLTLLRRDSGIPVCIREAKIWENISNS